MRNISICLLLSLALNNCNKRSSDGSTPAPANFSISSWFVNGVPALTNYYDINKTPVIKLNFSAPVNRNTVSGNIKLADKSGGFVTTEISYERSDSLIVLKPVQPLTNLTRYVVSVASQLKSISGGNLNTPAEINFVTLIDSSEKYPVVPDDSLLSIVQKQTFKYFWDFGHPVSGLARERNSSGDVVTSGGSGFGIMAIVAGINRQFISRQEGLTRLQKIVNFLKAKAKPFHGAFSHWLNGATGDVVPFSNKDNGADLVETSYLMQGLLTARQYFDGVDSAETSLRNDINVLWNGVEWSWFRKNDENVLYWHWSPDYSWDMNHQIRGWNECLITYILAASSSSYTIPKIVYDNGWAMNGEIKNNNSYYGIQLPLGQPLGGPLFFAHYSFLGLDPGGLIDAYANYFTQNTAHTLINYNYCKANPKNYFGYSELCWGLTASDDNVKGYLAHEPNNDDGVISPTAALSSFPYTPVESMRALKFFYYTLGDHLWKEYGFVDAFSLKDPWFANSFLAIDQGPIIIMIENYRSGLLWNLFMTCPEVKSGLLKLGFQSPHL